MLLIRCCKYESVNIKHLKNILIFFSLSFPVIIIIWVAILTSKAFNCLIVNSVIVFHRCVKMIIGLISTYVQLICFILLRMCELVVRINEVD